MEDLPAAQHPVRGAHLWLADAHELWGCPVNVAFALLAANAFSLSCVVDPPRSVSTLGVAANPIGLPPEMNQWKFDLQITDKSDTTDIKLDWPGDPIRAGRALAAFPIG